MKHFIPLSLALLASGCSLLQKTPEEPLIGSLSYQPAEVTRGPVQSLNKTEIIENYRKLLELRPEQNLHSEATRRLADLELEERESRLLDESETAPTSAAASVGLSSIQLYESLLRDNPEYANRDLVLYQLSRAYELAGDQTKMMQALDRLVSDHPQSTHWAEAQFRRGERLFVLQQFANAEQAYAAILEYRKQSRYFDRALFKHGWARFKQRRIEAGLDSFTLLLDRKLNDLPELKASLLSPADQELLKETLRVMSLTFSELGGTGRIGSYFKTQGRRHYEFMVYRGLGDLYQKQERIGDAAEAYLAFVESDPTHPQAPRLAVDVIELYAANDFPAQALLSKKAFTRRYQINSEYWQQLGKADREWLSERLRGYLQELAEYHHALAQQTGKGKQAVAERNKHGSEAIFWYQRYLASFPNETGSGGMSFLLAELLYELKRFAEAVDAYEKSAYHYPRHAQDAEAGYAALLAYHAAERGLAEDALQTWRRKGIDSALRFAESFPQDPRRASVLTQSAEQLLALNELTLARKTAAQVTMLQPTPKPEQLRTAWTVVAHCAFEQTDFQAAELAYQSALALLPADANAENRSQLQERLAASIYQGASRLRDQGQHRQAADQYLRIAQVTPLASIRAIAEFDAAASLITIKDWPGTIQILEGLRSRNPKSKLIPDINNKLAVAYLETGQTLKAAEELSNIAVEGETPVLRREAGWQAAKLYEKANRRSEAIHAYSWFVKTFPQPIAQSMEARQRLVELYDAQNAIRKRDHWLQEIVQTDAKAGEARSDRTRYLAAHARFRLTQPVYDRFQAIQLKAPLKKNLKLKKKQMQIAIADYKKAAAYGVAEITTAATYRIGELYQQFGEALLESERPQNLNEEELEQYEILLEEQAYPFEDKAITLHETNAHRAAQGVYDPWVKKSFDALARLLPVRYAKQEKTEDLIDAIN
ncbi:MAG: tetratricopeptide repeat protein [Gammaproteobacteria bacterium]|nr:tetratricopeptide repeat protein [Gammaproteobacteria bacterium]